LLKTPIFENSFRKRLPGGGFVRLVYLMVLLANLFLAACGEASPAPAPTTSSLIQDSSKIDTTLRDLLVSYQSGGIEAARNYAKDTGLLDSRDRVRFGLILTGAAAAPTVTGQVQKMGGEVYSSSGEQLAVAVDLDKLTAYFNPSDKRNFLQELASFKEVKELKLLLAPSLAGPGLTDLTAPNAALNEGVALTGADRWQKVGFNGQNIKIGIIDGGFAGYRGYLGSALPPAGQVQFESFLPGQAEGSENHGVAVAEIVHSLAPEASLVLAPIEDEIGFSRAVQSFINKKVQIIQISLGWGGIFPGDGTGKMVEMLDAARRAGILPVVSTGNYGQSHYMATFNPDQNGFQRFDGDRLTLKLKAQAASAWVALRWEEPWDAPQTNLDLYLLDPAQRPLASSRNEQGQGFSKPPSELAPFRAQPGQDYYIQIKWTNPDKKDPPPANLRFHLFAYNATLEEATPESSLATPADAHGALSVGATRWQDDKLEPYSSRGPTGDNRAKPELVGPSGITGSVFKQPFEGTSAAAPQVSGAAALVWSAAPELSADQVAAYLQRNAFDLGTAGPDPLYGFGRVKLGSEEAAREGLPGLLGPVANGAPFSDDFSASDSGLPNNKLAFYSSPGGTNQGYQVVARPGQLNWNSYLDRSFEEFRASVTIQPEAASPALFYGLVFWQQGPDDYYAWLVSGQRYALFKRSGPAWIALSDWSQEAALQGSGAVAAGLEATGSYIRLSLGGKIIQTITFKSGSKVAPPRQLGGKFGFGAGLFDLGQAASGGSGPVVAFRNLFITPLTTR
jgi:subtilisin family serine protease